MAYVAADRWSGLRPLLLLCLLTTGAATTASVTVDAGGSRSVTLAVTGANAFRVSVGHGSSSTALTALDTLMVAPRAPAAAASVVHYPATAIWDAGAGLNASFGAVIVANETSSGQLFLTLFDISGKVLVQHALLGPGPDAAPSCEDAGKSNTDKSSGNRIAALMVDLQSGCCSACLTTAGCDTWVFATDAGSQGNNCWLMSGVHSTKSAPNRVLGQLGNSSKGGLHLSLGASPAGRSYGFGGADQEAGVDGDPFAATSVTPVVGNKVWRTPSYWASEGYAALAVAASSHSASNLQGYGAQWSRSAGSVTWTVEGRQADLFLAPATMLADGVSAIASLTGGAAVPPSWAFGFLACRWGWDNRSNIEQTLHKFRDGGFPLDAFISDYGWFTDVPNSPQQNDFGYNPSTFPDPAVQLQEYHNNLHVKFGGIRKPRIANETTLAEVTAKGFLLHGAANNLNFSQQAARDWYAKKQAQYLVDGVDFWWNDEGETQFENYHLWNLAHQQALTAYNASKRLFTLNRAYTPGIARLGVGVWTGDIDVSWQAFQRTPATVLRWSLAGAFFVACDTGGFEGSATPPELLARWYQLSALLPIMRVHSRVQNPPHWPWLYGAAAEAAMREALALRYRLLPMVYSLAHHARTDGTPLVRPLMYTFPDDVAVIHVSDEFTMGSSLLTAPVLEESATERLVLLPRLSPASANAVGWFEFGSSRAHAGGQQITVLDLSLNTMPLYVRAGGILPLAPQGVQYVASASSSGALEVQIYAGIDGSFVLVEDDGETVAYDGPDPAAATRRTELSWSESTNTLTWTCTGTYAGGAAYTSLKAVVFRSGEPTQSSEEVQIGSGGKLVIGSSMYI